ncbi:MAG: hypothetical protein E6Q97_06875 [Desulfurellales bacterium]|nr:MAG: hypothetical protein E6Q97_06875 [Desulfurellales bacterium]
MKVDHSRKRAHGPGYRVAVDVDGTLYAGPWTQADEFTGPPTTDDAIPFLQRELAAGHEVILHTCRLTPEYPWCTWPVDQYRDPAHVIAALRAWLIHWGLSPADTERLHFWTHAGKPSADEYLDDRAVRFEGVFPRRPLCSQ